MKKKKKKEHSVLLLLIVPVPLLRGTVYGYIYSGTYFHVSK